MALSTQIQLGVIANLTSALDLATASVPLQKTYQAALTTGTAVGQADIAWHDQRTIAASGTDDLDLNGTLAGLLGGTVGLVKVKGLIIAAAAGNTNDVVVGAAAANPWIGLLNATGTAKVKPGGFIAACIGEADANGYAVVPATGDILRVANGGAGTPVTYDIIVFGTSA